jgi:hypothetical protein
MVPDLFGVRVTEHASKTSLHMPMFAIHQVQGIETIMKEKPTENL